jgi:ACS family tartrate transporter-like MFS transporter
MSSATASSAPPGTPVTRNDTEVARATMRRVSLRLFPLLFALFVFNYVDRTNVAMAALQMKTDLGLSATAYGFGYGIFFWGYALFEVPSNLVLARVGARRWIARIVISWGLIACAMAFMRTPEQFYGLRMLLGVAEAGFYPGIVYYLSHWFPAAQRARALSRFIVAIPLSLAVGNPLGGWLLGFDGSYGLSGWQWLFLVEGIPSVMLGFIVLAFLTDRPEHASWLSDEHRAWLVERLGRDGDESAAPHRLAPLRALLQPMVWLVSLLYFLYALTFYGYLFWAPTFVRDTLRASELVTGLVTGLIAGVAAVAMLAAGANSDRTGDRCVHMSVGMTLVAFGFLSAALLSSPIARVAGLGLVLVGNMTFCAPFWCLPSMLLRGSAAAAGIALVNSVGNIGGAVSPYLIGRFKDVTGSASGAFLALAIVAVGAVSMSLMFRRQTAFASTLPSCRLQSGNQIDHRGHVARG